MAKPLLGTGHIPKQKQTEARREMETPSELAYPDLTHQLGDEPPEGYPVPARPFPMVINKQNLMRRWNCTSDVLGVLAREGVLIPKIKLRRVCLYSFPEVCTIEKEGWKGELGLPPPEAFPMYDGS